MKSVSEAAESELRDWLNHSSFHTTVDGQGFPRGYRISSTEYLGYIFSICSVGL